LEILSRNSQASHPCVIVAIMFKATSKNYSVFFSERANTISGGRGKRLV
jgi:hypothetical protein